MSKQTDIKMVNKTTFSDKLKTYLKHPGSFIVMLLVLLAAVVSPLSVALSVLLAAALHECGHLLALRAFHVPVEGLHLSAFGAVIHARGARRLSYGRELIVTLAGCGMNLVF